MISCHDGWILKGSITLKRTAELTEVFLNFRRCTLEGSLTLEPRPGFDCNNLLLNAIDSSSAE